MMSQRCHTCSGKEVTGPGSDLARAHVPLREKLTPSQIPRKCDQEKAGRKGHAAECAGDSTQSSPGGRAAGRD